MIEPVFPDRQPTRFPLIDQPPEAATAARDIALLDRATGLAVESALSYARDVPVGAVLASEDWIIGRYFSSDRRTGYSRHHAEYMALLDWQMTKASAWAPEPDTIVVTLEPCDRCQDFLATVPGLKRVAFGLLRSAAADRGIVKPHQETIFERTARVGQPYEVVQIEHQPLQAIGSVLLDHTRRDTKSEVVQIDRAGLQEALAQITS